MLECNVCHAKYKYEDFREVALMREMADLASRFGKAWKFVEAYVECFRAGQFSRITMKKRVLLLKEICQIFESERFQYNRKSYRISRVDLVDGMYLCVKKDLVNLQNHNYLYKVVLEKAEILSVEGLTAREEAKSIEHRAKRDNAKDAGVKMTYGEYLDKIKGLNARAPVDQMTDKLHTSDF